MAQLPVSHHVSPPLSPADQPPGPGGKTAHAPGAAARVTSVSTGNLCAEEQSPPPRPEAYPIPTQTYAREYFTFPASKSQDRVAPSQHQWADYEEKPRVHVDGSHSSIGVQVRGAPRHSSGSESRVDGRVRIW